LKRALPYVVPYFAFLIPTSLAPYLPEAWEPWLEPFRTLASAVAMLFYASRGAYPELRRTVPAHRAATWLAIGAGLAVAFTWMPLTRIVPQIGSRGGFHPEIWGAALAPWLWASRLVAFVLVIPFAEELLVRSFLPRWIDDPDGWPARGIGVFTRVSAAISIGFFTFTHPEWLAALVTGALWTGLLAATRRLGDAVLAHAIANGVLAVIWSFTGERGWW
jgi:CAAX prenyl protease-like protein